MAKFNECASCYTHINYIGQSHDCPDPHYPSPQVRAKHRVKNWYLYSEYIESDSYTPFGLKFILWTLAS